MNALVPIQTNNVDAYRASTDAAAMCKAIVVESAMEIQGRKYVKVEGWQAIAIAHGCTASARNVERIDGGFRAIGEVRRMDDGTVIAEAEGFVGEDEPTWFGGEQKNKWGNKTLPKRPDYAIRCMAQTRAISRACRSAFAHVVVMMNAGLSTTPAEEVPLGGFERDDVIDAAPTPQDEPAAREKLEGKHASKAALATALRAYGMKVGLAHTIRELDAIDTEYADDLSQGKRYLPKWFTGDPEKDSKGFTRLVSERRAFLDLLDNMRENRTPQALSQWLGANSDTIEGLGDGEGREFEKVLAEFEEALKVAAHATAG